MMQSSNTNATAAQARHDPRHRKR
jgi:hypothetical protein